MRKEELKSRVSLKNRKISLASGTATSKFSSVVSTFWPDLATTTACTVLVKCTFLSGVLKRLGSVFCSPDASISERCCAHRPSTMPQGCITHEVLLLVVQSEIAFACL